MAMAAIFHLISTAPVRAHSKPSHCRHTELTALDFVHDVFDDPDHNGGGICAPIYADSAVFASEGCLVLEMFQGKTPRKNLSQRLPKRFVFPFNAI